MIKITTTTNEVIQIESGELEASYTDMMIFEVTGPGYEFIALSKSQKSAWLAHNDMHGGYCSVKEVGIEEYNNYINHLFDARLVVNDKFLNLETLIREAEEKLEADIKTEIDRLSGFPPEQGFGDGMITYVSLTQVEALVGNDPTCKEVFKIGVADGDRDAAAIAKRIIYRDGQVCADQQLTHDRLLWDYETSFETAAAY